MGWHTSGVASLDALCDEFDSRKLDLDRVAESGIELVLLTQQARLLCSLQHSPRFLRVESDSLEESQGQPEPGKKFGTLGKQGKLNC